MIDVDHVSKLFKDNRAVSDISFRVEAGERLSLLGTSGCGKTTTVRMINRLTEPSAGKIFVNGRNVLDQQPETLRRSIGYVIQNHGLFPHYSVIENISLVPTLLKMDKSATRKRSLELMEKLHLSPSRYLHAYPDELSGGQQQRVGLARALAADPPVLLMDEPFGALDTVTRTSIRKDLLELDEFRKKTIILVTHDVQEAFAMCDRICVMDKGRIVQLGTPRELLFKPANQFVSDFLKEERTQLVFKTILLTQIWDALTGDDSEASTADFNASIHSSVWDIMEFMCQGKGLYETGILVKHPAFGAPKRILLADLLLAINHINHPNNA